MNHTYYVPDFELTPNPNPNPASSSTARPTNKSVVAAPAATTTAHPSTTTDEEDMMELLWQDGHVVFQSQNQRSQRKHDAAIIMPPKNIPQHTEEAAAAAANLFMQEDEMTTWLHYPLDDTPNLDRDLYADFLYHPPPPPPPPLPRNCTLPASSSLPPLAQNHHHHLKPPTAPGLNNFTHFSSSRYRGITHEQGLGEPSISNQTMTRQPTVVDSSDTPALALGKAPESRISSHVSTSTMNNSPTTKTRNAMLGISSPATAATAAAAGETDVGTCDFTLSSSPSRSPAASDSMSVEPTTPKPSPPVMEDRKRKGRAAAVAEDDAGCHQNQGIDISYSDVKKKARGTTTTTSTKKSRAAEVHNLSERKRRDRINEKMKALQELIPRCNKSDKASMLDEAIEYLKSLQLQVQMMSMGCTMVPMMFPGIQHYMPTVGMGMGMGIGPGMGITRPMMQFPHVHPGSSVQGQSSTSHMAPRFPTSAFPLPPPPPGVAMLDSNRIQATNLPDSVMNTAATQNLSHPQMQNVVVDPYQQYYISTNQSRMSMFTQNPTVLMQPNTSEPGGSGSSSNHRNLQSG